MKENNYFPSVVVGGEEWVGKTPLDLTTAYDEALRMKTERNAEEASVKVFTPGAFIIRNWKLGKYNKLAGSFLYSIPVR